jgi:NAD(P)-dependent dehydrogenase (short-subunit alcohol dehydrogenase family)
MARHLTILTGASRGMGLAMAEQLIDAGHTLLCISRKTNGQLAAHATARGATLEQWPHDLARAATVCGRLETWLDGMGPDDFASATLINNAAIIPQLAPLADIAAEDVAEALRVDLEAPMLLTGAFLRATTTWRGTRKVLNISSGNGRRPMAAQATYSAAKAGMDHYTRCVALEEALRENGAKICSLAPGVIDTDMQTQLRRSDPSKFPDLPRFVDLKDQGMLTSPADAAARVLAYLARADFGTNPVADVRDAA